MKVCKVRPSASTCSACLDMQIEYKQIRNCAECSCNTQEYELLQIGTSFWSGNYAMVLANGRVEKVALDRVHDIREKEET